LLLDAISERYGVLPSQLLKEGNTFDLQIFDIAMSYRSYQASKDSGKPMSASLFDEESLKQSLENVRNGYKGK